MLKRVRLENFKAWEEVDLDLGSVAGLFGANSAGKTSLLQFLLLLKQTRNATDRGLVLDFGGTEALVDLATSRMCCIGMTRSGSLARRWIGRSRTTLRLRIPISPARSCYGAIALRTGG